jgi:hypothetical protein
LIGNFENIKTLFKGVRVKKLLAVLLIINSTFHSNAMLYETKGEHHSTSGVVLHYTLEQVKYVVLRKYYQSRQEFPNVVSYGPLFEWKGADQKPMVESHIHSLLSALALKKAAQHEGSYDSQSFTLFTAEDETCATIYALPKTDGIYGEVVAKKLTDFYYNQGYQTLSSRFYQDPDTKELFCMPQAFHETFQKTFFGPVIQDEKSSQE